MQQGINFLQIDTQLIFTHDSDRIFSGEYCQYIPIDETQATVIVCESSREFLMRMGIAGEIIPTVSHSEESVSLVLDDVHCLIDDLEPFEYMEAYGDHPSLEDDWERIWSFHLKSIHLAHRPESIVNG